MTRGAIVLVGVACAGAPPGPSADRCASTRVLATQADVEARRGCTAAATLVVRAAGPLSLEPLAALKRVDGDLWLGPTLELSSVALPSLAHVGRLRISASPAVASVHLPALRRARSIELDGLPALTTWSTPVLAEVEGDLSVAGAPSLELVALDALTRVGGTLRLRGVPGLTLVEAPRLREVGALEVPADTTRWFPGLGAPLARPATP